MKYLADIVELRGVEISVFPVYRAPRDAVGQILARHIIIYPGIFERFAVIEQDEIIQMLSVNLALDRRVYSRWRSRCRRCDCCRISTEKTALLTAKRARQSTQNAVFRE